MPAPDLGVGIFSKIGAALNKLKTLNEEKKMYALNLSIEEHQALLEVLESSISELHSQIVHTDRYDYKKLLKNRKQVLVGLLKDLQQDHAATQMT
jgi:hypothetical protein